MSNRVRFDREYRFHAPLHEKNDDELLVAVHRQYQDAAAARAELRARGWDDSWINRRNDGAHRFVIQVSYTNFDNAAVNHNETWIRDMATPDDHDTGRFFNSDGIPPREAAWKALQTMSGATEDEADDAIAIEQSLDGRTHYSAWMKPRPYDKNGRHTLA